MRQALAGMLWSKQCYYFDVDHWLREREAHPLRESRRRGSRNESWFHMVNHDVVSMPDKWEYPWYAAWDLAFHCVALSIVDPDFALRQIDLMLSSGVSAPERSDPRLRVEFRRREPTGARVRHHCPAQARIRSGEVGLAVPGGVLRAPAGELHVVGEPQGPDGTQRLRGRVSRSGQHRRVRPQRDAAHRQATSSRRTGPHGWRCSVRTCSNCRSRCSSTTRVTSSSCSSSLSTSSGSRPRSTRWAITPTRCGTRRTGSSTTCLRLPNGSGTRIKVRSLVGLLPLCATTVIEPDVIERYPKVAARVRAFLERNEDLLANIADPRRPGVGGRRLLSLVNEHKLRRILTRMLDEERFLGPHGIRSISRWHLDHPYVFDVARSRVSRPIRTRRVDHANVWRELELAGAGVVSDQRAADPGAAPALPLLRRRAARSSARPVRAR